MKSAGVFYHDNALRRGDASYYYEIRESINPEYSLTWTKRGLVFLEIAKLVYQARYTIA